MAYVLDTSDDPMNSTARYWMGTQRKRTANCKCSLWRGIIIKYKKIFWLDVSSQIQRNTSKWHTILVDFYPSLPVFILTALKQMGLIVLLQKGQNQGSSSLRRRLISISLLTQSAKPKQTCSILIGGLWQPRNVKTVGTIKNYFTEPLIRHERCAEKQESTFCQCWIWMGGWIWITDGKKNFSLIRY